MMKDDLMSKLATLPNLLIVNSGGFECRVDEMIDEDYKAWGTEFEKLWNAETFNYELRPEYLAAQPKKKVIIL